MMKAYGHYWGSFGMIASCDDACSARGPNLCQPKILLTSCPVPTFFPRPAAAVHVQLSALRLLSSSAGSALWPLVGPCPAMSQSQCNLYQTELYTRRTLQFPSFHNRTVCRSSTALTTFSPSTIPRLFISLCTSCTFTF
jgi:hypothetical protein